MKRTLPGLFPLLLALSGFVSPLAPAGLARIPVPQQTVGWYKVMTGTIDKYPVSMYLFCLGSTVNGYYYSDKSGVPISVSGELKTGNLQLRAPGDRRGKEVFTGALTDSTFSGSWSIGGQTLPFQLHTIPRDSGYMPFNFVHVKGTQKRAKRAGEAGIDYGPSYEASTIWPSDSSALSALLRQDIFAFLSLPWKEGTAVGQALVRSGDVFLTNGNRDVSENQPSYEYEATLDILYQTSGLLSLSMVDYSFTGGAHGNSREIYRCYDLKAARRLNIGDIIDTLHYSGAMSALLEQSYRTNKQIPPDTRLSESLFKDTIPLNNNFYLTGEGIGFYYNTYEIGPYVAGGNAFYFPYSQLLSYLQPSFRRRMGL
jgi:hypothetical protein